MAIDDIKLTAELWEALGGSSKALDTLSFKDTTDEIFSRFRVMSLATATLAAANLAVQEIWQTRTQNASGKVHINKRHVAAAFLCERLTTISGKKESNWDPIAGDYRAADGWIRLHTNYSTHRKAVLDALSADENKEAVARKVATWKATELEDAVVARGGCAAALLSPDEWANHPQGKAVATERLIFREGQTRPTVFEDNATAPLSGIKVVDLTRVLAGPIGTRFLAGFGAEVLRIDPPGFNEGIGLAAETSRGKRCAYLNLQEGPARKMFEKHITEADLLVVGYRSDALTKLNYSSEQLRRINPDLKIVRICAYGWTGPWAARRGFDSIVQMSTGIAMSPTGGSPTPLPAQALDHATGYLVAAAACRALISGTSESRLSLARVARLLVDLGINSVDTGTPSPAGTYVDLLETHSTEWGDVAQVKCPGFLSDFSPHWSIPSGSLGRHLL